MAEVWLAEGIGGPVKTRVALKLPRAGILTSEFARRLRCERDILARLSHEGIVQLHGAEVESSRPWLALEFIEGIALGQHCAAQRLSVLGRANLFLQLLIAVEEAHANLVIHGDLKPSNVLVTTEGRVKLIDFGAARMVSAATTSAREITSICDRALTPAYAPPEQIAGHPINAASDIYSLGVILCELLSGERPPAVDACIRTHAGVDATSGRAKGDKRNSERKRTTVLRGALEAIALKATTASPAERYATANNFRSTIEHYLAEEPETSPEVSEHRAN